MDSIITSIPWQCGDKDCKAQWHLSSYWLYSDGTYSVDELTDGDHEDCDEDDLPSYEEEKQAWAEYAAHVAATGEDPLGNYMVERTTTRRERWTLDLGRSILGVTLRRARRGRGAWVAPRDLPQHVREFAGMTGKFAGNGGALIEAAWDDIKEQCTRSGRLTETLEVKLPRDPAKVRRELQRLAARKA